MSFETKYVAPARLAPLLLHGLRATCAPDPRFRVNRVHSVYLDTETMTAMAEVENGDYLKAKCRVRWYEGPAGVEGPLFLECKCKLGTRRAKARLPLASDHELRPDMAMDDPAWTRVPNLLRGRGVDVPAGLLQPTVHVAYRRHRFVDPTSGLRLALDADIRVLRVHPRMSRVAAIVRESAPYLVFETKGDVRRLPPHLRFLFDMGARRRAFSKYGLWRDSLRAAWGG